MQILDHFIPQIIFKPQTNRDLTYVRFRALGTDYIFLLRVLIG